VITGVSRSALTDAYIAELGQAIDDNMESMTEIIKDATQKITGYHSSQWSWCELTNTSVPGGVQWSCPTTTDSGVPPNQVLIALYNPSLVTHRVVSLPIHDSLYDVSVFEPIDGHSVAKAFVPAKAGVLCDYFNPHNSSACKLYVNYTVHGQHIGYLMLSRNTSRQGLLVQYQLKGASLISMPHGSLELLSIDPEDGAIFELTKKLYIGSFKFAFDLRYYLAYQGFEGSRAGASVFRPVSKDSLRYSNLTKVFVQRSDIVSQITLVYQDSDNETAVVKARMTFDSPLIEWDVNMETIPVTDQGKELIVSF